MDGIILDRRRVKQPREAEWKRMLNAEQADTLRSLEQFGWQLRFVRTEASGGRLAAVYDPDRKVYAIIADDGRLMEDPKLAFRAEI